MVQCSDLLTDWRRNVMQAGLPVAGLPVSTKLPTPGEPQVGPAPESHLHYQVGRGASRVLREINTPASQAPHGVAVKARNRRPPLVGRATPVVEGRLSGKPRIERTAR